jgi:DNA polymerase III delta subunit
MGRLRPKVFWKRNSAFETQAGSWPVPRLREAIAELVQLDIELKVGEAAPELLAGRALLRLAVNAPGRRRSRKPRR